jgi:hypothetical protein
MIRRGVLTLLLAIAGCATSTGEQWQHVDPSQPINAEQLHGDKLSCLNQSGAPGAGAAAPLSATRNQMIDCMRMKGWVKR